MKIITFIIITVIIIVNCTGNLNKEKSAIMSAVKAELENYPEERLIDLYKSFFQGYWGPGHLVPDSISAHNYLTRELTDAQEYDTNLWQSLGHYDRYFRLNLKFVRDGIIPEGEYLSAFIQSANNPNKPKLADWITEWNKVINVIEKNEIIINNYSEDKKAIQMMLDDGNYVVHHSDEFRKTYNPHYRVISKNYFDRLMDKYIRK